MLGVAPADERGDLRRFQPLLRILADRLEKPVARLSGAVVGDDERLVDQLAEDVEHVDGIECVADQDRFGRDDVATAGEDREPVEGVAFELAQQVVRPVDGAPERLLPFERGAAAAREELEALVEPVDKVVRCHRTHTCGRQLDRERDPVEPPAQLRDRVRVLGREREVVLRVAGPVDEQVLGFRAVERPHGDDLFSGHRQALAAGCKHRDLRTSLRDAVDDACRRVEQVLAVVEDHQRALVREVVEHDRVGAGAERLHTQAGGEGVPHVVGIRDRRQLAEPGPVGELGQDLGRGLDRQPRLADTAHARERDQ